MQVWQIVIITIIAFLKKADHKGTQIAIYNSMFWGGLTGLVMGDFTMGLCIGGTFQLMSLGLTAVGGASIPDYQVGAIISTAIAVSTGMGAEAGIAIGLPVAMVCVQLDVIMNLVHGVLIRKAQIYNNRGRYRAMMAMMWLCLIVTGLSTAFPVFLAVAFGPDVAKALIEIIPSWFLSGLAVAGKMLPVCGVAALMMYMPTRKYFEYLLFGFVLSAYLNVPILGVAIVGVGFAHMLYKKRIKELVPVDKCLEKDTDCGKTEAGSSLLVSDLRRVGWRWNMAVVNFNYETQMAGAVVYALAPALRKIYKEDSDFKESINNHFKFFNITPWFGNLMLGAVLALEDSRKMEARDAVQNLKVGLMGPVSGFGDSIFFVLLPAIFGSIGGYMALEGNPAGLFVWLVYSICVFFIRPRLVEIGYRSGLRMLNNLGGRLNIIVEAASALGLSVVGSMITTVVSIKTPLTYVSGDMVKEIQPILDSIMPSMLPAAFAAIVFVLLRKKIKLTYIILGLIVLSCFCAKFGILS